PQAKKSQATASDTETKAAPTTTEPAESEKGTSTAKEIGTVYLTNAALADEKFADERVAVTGNMHRIEAVGARTLKNEVLYDLEMFSGAADNRHVAILKFRFTDNDRKQLAQLRVGQAVTIEGKPQKAPRLNKGEVEIP